MTRLRDLIEQAGGLYTKAGLARRWGISRSRVQELAKSPDFPEPIAVVDEDREVWTGKDADAWRQTPRRIGRPPQQRVRRD